MIAAFTAVMLATTFWALVRQDALLARGDNPRRILLERRVPRGAILDRRGVILAQSMGAPGALVRRYPYPNLAPVLGYISPLFGSAGIEAAMDGILHGGAEYTADELLWRGNLLGDWPPGQAVQLSIDLDLQALADYALAGRTGALVLVDAVSGDILVMASHPTYDPNRLEADWPALVSDARAPLVNRAALGQYQPGGVLWPIVVAGALQGGYGTLQQTFASVALPVAVNGEEITCRLAPSGELVTLAAAVAAGCPNPVAILGARLGEVALGQWIATFQLYTAPNIGLPTAPATAPPSIVDPRQAAIGQGELTVTPLQVALVAAAFARDGLLPAARLVIATETRDGAWRPTIPVDHPTSTMTPGTAQQMRTLLANGYSATALSGAEGQPLAWYMGFSPAQDARYAVAVLLEDGDEAAAAAIGWQVLTAAEMRDSQP